MNILLTGANGNIGSYLKKILENKYNVYALIRNDLDITNANAVWNVVDSIKPDIVIHTAAITNINVCERNETLAYATNLAGTINLSKACYLLDIPIVYLSTPHIFDGNSTKPYVEHDIGASKNIYGKTKLAGEQMIRTICEKYFIIRTSHVFGGNNCFINAWLQNRLQPLSLDYNPIINVTYIEDLCFAIDTIMLSDKYGIYNCTNEPSLCFYMLAKTAIDYAGLKKNVILLPNEYIANKVPRAKYMALDNSLIKKTFNINFPIWEERLREYITTYRKHEN